MINLGVFAFIIMAILSGFLLAFIAGFRQRTALGKRLQGLRSRCLRALPFSGYPRFFLMILFIAPLGMGIAILGPMLLLQVVLPVAWFAENQITWNPRIYLFAVVVLTSLIREI